MFTKEQMLVELDRRLELIDERIARHANPPRKHKSRETTAREIKAQLLRILDDVNAGKPIALVNLPVQRAPHGASHLTHGRVFRNTLHRPSNYYQRQIEFFTASNGEEYVKYRMIGPCKTHQAVDRPFKQFGEITRRSTYFETVLKLSDHVENKYIWEETTKEF